jgi:hypothetical protein
VSVRFICGCLSKMELPTSPDIFKTFDSVVLDHEGFIICLIHKERRYGWRTIPYTASAPYQALTAGMTPLEHEKWVVWGELPKHRSWPERAPVEDKRDNRDPEQVGREFQAAMAVARNGDPEYRAQIRDANA